MSESRAVERRAAFSGIQPFKEIALSAYVGLHVYPCGLLRYSGKTFSFTYSNQWLDAREGVPFVSRYAS